MLRSLPVPLEHVTDLEHARVVILADPHQVILTEALLPDGTWLDVLNLVRQWMPGPEVIVTDRQADARFWAEALNLGAYDLIARPFAQAEVRRILSYACSRSTAPRVAMQAAAV
jgi:DNA-binding NtrC family response regulator